MEALTYAERVIVADDALTVLLSTTERNSNQVSAKNLVVDKPLEKVFAKIEKEQAMQSGIDAQLEAMIDRDRAEREQEYCLDDLDFCNLCGKNLTDVRFVIDGEVCETDHVTLPTGDSVGQWAYMCSSSFSKKGVGIRWGKGQLYEQISLGEWLRVAGGPLEG